MPETSLEQLAAREAAGQDDLRTTHAVQTEVKGSSGREIHIEGETKLAAEASGITRVEHEPSTVQMGGKEIPMEGHTDLTPEALNDPGLLDAIGRISEGWSNTIKDIVKNDANYNEVQATAQHGKAEEPDGEELER